jgi:Ca-activated chloride channel homolog
MKKAGFRYFGIAVMLIALGCTLSGSVAARQRGSAKPTPSANTQKSAPSPATHATIQIDLDHAATVVLPQLSGDLHAAAFSTPDGKNGWAVRLPGGRPIATPAFADGLIFVGGGYGSHEFYAFNADTGALAWKINTKDDGPTAAVVEDGYVAFNTESCTIVVVDEKTGKVIWQEWLGDPLMSQPAISKGKLFMAYPAGAKGGRPGHRLLAADLRTGKHLWEQEITGDVISAPVISGNIVYLTCFDGTSFALDANTGTVIWKRSQSGTSAPLVANGEVIVASREQDGARRYEGLARLELAHGQQKNRELIARDKAEYLAAGNNGGGAVTGEMAKSLDSSVGFASAPAAAKLSAAAQNVGVSSVVGGWSYQGSRAAYNEGQVMNAQGTKLNSIRAADGSVAWRAEAKSAKVTGSMQLFSPPALGRKSIYVASFFGHVVSLRQKDGAIQFDYMFNTPIAFQPALANGNVYIGTALGLLICLKTGNSDADGWYAWGGNAQHNKN